MKRASFLFIFLINISLIAQKDNSSTNSFEIIIEKNGDEIKLECQKGCSWDRLHFTIAENVYQKIDKNGMIGLRGDSSISGINYKKFLFAIAQSGNEIKLIGLSGMAWNELHIPLRPNKSQAINQNGLLPGNR
ncbi:hypothetical protein [Mangrovivirga cuniculi]|uniref:Uncharacterized protein n=1 Tax=Mangrovivirga cuniculi TaxID=2715131 RepID=A0A4D7JST6_9BACT|nr:hypothetical protein [Mangrovivirga cuniculi]QCK15186.1 hypothetical protein DCC35_10725 [Mangrovivirga cuniculi]